MQGASPLASPGSEPARHWGRGEPRAQWEACPCLVGSACPSFALAPYPPDPLPPAGKGEIYSYLMQGAPPLASPGLEPGRHWFVPRWRLLKRRFLLNPRGTGVGASHVCGGRRAFLVSGCHCLPLAFLPLSPRPRSQSALPRRGRGRFIVILCKGLRPLHPRGLNPGGTGLSRGGDCSRGISHGIGHKRRPNNRFIREKFWGSGGLFQESPGVPRFP